MMKPNLFLLLLLTIVMFPFHAYSEDVNDSVYSKAGTIDVLDPKSVMVGSRQPGDALFELSLDDLEKYTGHVCAGVASGFLLTKQALEQLYPGDELPVRGEISMVASHYNDQTEVAAYVVRARERAGDEKEKNALIIDPSLAGAPKTLTLVFKRMDNGKMVKAVLDKSRILSEKEMKKVQALKKKVMDGSASEKEKRKFAGIVQDKVAIVITDTPDGLITVSRCFAYDFLEKEME